MSFFGSIGSGLGYLFGGAQEPQSSRDAVADINSRQVQSFLPDFLKLYTGKNKNPQATDLQRALGAGQANLNYLLRNPGALPGNVSASIAPFMSLESERIARDTSGLQAQAAGQAARGGIGSQSGLAQAMQIAIARAGAGEQGRARREAIGMSAKLGREDLDNLFKVYQTILAFTGQGRSLMAGRGAQQFELNEASRRQGAATVAQLFSSGFGMMGGGTKPTAIPAG